MDGKGEGDIVNAHTKNMYCALSWGQLYPTFFSPFSQVTFGFWLTFAVKLAKVCWLPQDRVEELTQYPCKTNNAGCSLIPTNGPIC